MSIINEALKKVEEENQKRTDSYSQTTVPQTQTPKYEFKPNLTREKATKKPVYISLLLILIFISAFVIVKMLPLNPSKEKIADTKLIAEGYSSIPNQEVTTLIPSLDIPALTLHGIVYDDKMPYAIINNKILRKGDMIEGAALLEIDRNFVRFAFKDKEFEIRTKQ